MPLDIDAIMKIVKSNIGDGMDIIDGDAIAKGAAQDLAMCINDAMGGLSGREKAAVGDAEPGGILYLGLGNYLINVDIQSQTRASILPDIYGGVTDMAALFNNGYAAANQIIAYDEFGNFIGATRQFRNGERFVQDGLASFWGSGDGAYTVLDVKQVGGRFG